MISAHGSTAFGWFHGGALPQGKLGGAVASLAGTSSGRILKRPTSNSVLSTPTSSSYFSSAPWTTPSASTSNGLRTSRSFGALGSSGSPLPDSLPGTPSMPNVTSAASAAETGRATPIKLIRFGEFDVDTWYQAPYPEEYSLVPDGRLWICEFCLKYMESRFMAGRHRVSARSELGEGLMGWWSVVGKGARRLICAENIALKGVICGSA